MLQQMNLQQSKRVCENKDIITATNQKDKTGAFVRHPSSWRSLVSKHPENRFQPQFGRYHLYLSYSCPWAHRTLIVRSLKGLQDCISVSIVAATWQKTRPKEPKDFHVGWVFRSPQDNPQPNPAAVGLFSHQGCIPDFVNKAKTVRELYELAGDTRGKFSVPILWDKKLSTIVSNQSSEIILMLNDEFNEFAKRPDLDLAPQHLRMKMAAVDSWVYNYINNGVYKAGFSGSQEAYDKAIDQLFQYLEKAEYELGQKRFLCGKVITLSDIKLFVTLVRFDEVYAVYFKCDKKRISQFHNLMGYCQDLYQTPGIGQTVNMDHIKVHYYTSHPNLNFYAIVPRGPNFEGKLKQKHDRAQRFLQNEVLCISNEKDQ